MQHWYTLSKTREISILGDLQELARKKHGQPELVFIIVLLLGGGF